MTDPLVQELLDRQEITALLHAYCRYVDHYRPADIASLFTDDCVVSYGPTLGGAHGAGELESSLRAGLARYAATSHHLSNVEVGFDGPDRATGSAYVYAWHRMRDGRPDAHLWARYYDVFVRTAAGWRIAERRLVVAGEVDFDLAWDVLPREPVEG